MGQLNVRIDDGLHRAVRIRIIESGGHRGSLRSLVESALRQYLATFCEKVDQNLVVEDNERDALLCMVDNEGRVE